MLQHLYVRNLALIKEVGVDFTNGFNVLTGETGAGKSMLMGSIGILMGQRASKDLIGNYEDTLYIEGVFKVSSREEVKLNELGVESEEGQLIISVTISTKGKIAKCNAKTIPASLLKAIGQALITVHGQHESQILLNEKAHIQILDTFGKKDIGVVYQSYLNSYRQLRSMERQMLQKKKLYQQYYREKDLLEFELEEINEHIFKENEDVLLEAKYQKMKTSKKILEKIEYALHSLTQSEEGIGQGIYQLSQVKDFGQDIQETYSQLLDADELFKDSLKSLSQIEANLDFDDAKFEIMEARLEKINHLKDKYGGSLSTIWQIKEEKETILSSIQNFEIELRSLRQEILARRKEIVETYKVLLKERQRWAYQLEEAMNKALVELNFEKVDFKVKFIEKEHFDEIGKHEVLFLISTNEGIEPKPIKEIASGGELSRIMLCLKSIIASTEDAGMIVFDEVDAGISGVTAEKVGQKLTLISEHTQVICITHLAQITARARNHLLVEKFSQEGQTITSLRKLKEEESILELARILGGSIQSPQIIQSAREMKSVYQSNS